MISLKLKVSLSAGFAKQSGLSGAAGLCVISSL